MVKGFSIPAINGLKALAVFLTSLKSLQGFILFLAGVEENCIALCCVPQVMSPECAETAMAHLTPGTESSLVMSQNNEVQGEVL